MIKYRIPYKSYDDSSWLITIDLPGYSGEPIDVRAEGGNAGRLTYDGGVDDQWDYPMVNVTLLSELYNQGQIDVEELQLVEDRQCLVTLYRNDEVKFKGYLIADSMQRQFTSPPYRVGISASSGLNLLESIDYLGFGGELGARVPLNYFRRILCSTFNLGIELPIRWTKTVEAIQTEIAGDAFEHARWSPYGEGFSVTNIKTGETIYHTCGYIIEGITKALKCRIFQADGAWWVLGVKESLADVIAYRECANATGLPVITEHTRNSVRDIGSQYRVLGEDAVITVKPALSEVNVTYTHNQRENILPNGGQDIYNFGAPMWWVQDSVDVSVSEHVDITEQGGKATEVHNTGSLDRRFYLSSPLPIDANILYRRLTWGFSFLPYAGFDIDQNDFIDWKHKKIKTSVKYTVNKDGILTDYYLNEFGYWGNRNTSANQQVTSIGWHPSGDALTIQFVQGRNFYPGDEVIIIFQRSGVMQRHSIVFEETMDPRSGVDFIASKIPNSSSINDWSVQILGVTNTPDNTAFTRKVEDYYKYIYFTVDNLKLNDAASVTYRGASNLDVYIVDPGKLDPAPVDGVGLLSIEFILGPGMRVALDDIWMKVDQNNDVYQVKNSSTKNANVQNIDLTISSAFSGFKVSNFMRAYYSSNKDWKFTDGIHTGSLTELYARAVMASRYKPSAIFNANISTRGYDWSFLDNYTVAGLEGKKFIPLNPTYNTEKNEVDLIAIEDRSDSVSFQVTHKGNNKDNEI